MPERTYVTMAALGTDQPGLVRLVSQYVARRGGNIEDSRMVALGGVCGLMLLISADPPAAARLAADVAALERQTGLRVLTEGAHDSAVEGGPEGAETGWRGGRGARGVGALWVVTASAADWEGMLADLTDVVRGSGGHIVELDTTTYQAPPDGRAMFELKMTVALRAAGEVARMKDALMTIGAEQRIALDIKPAERSATKAFGLTLLS
jgi:glycine cleavage system regulatory protein